MLDLLERQRQLVGIEPLRAPAEARALQCWDDRTQPIALMRETRDLLGMTRALSDEQRAKGFGIGREIVGVGRRHAVRL